MPPGKNSVERFSTPKSNCVFLSLWKYTTLCAWCQFFWGVFLSFSDIPRIFKRAAEIFGGKAGELPLAQAFPLTGGTGPLTRGVGPQGDGLRAAKGRPYGAEGTFWAGG